MGEYKFVGEVDIEKVFVVKSSELINRVDPYFYKNEFKTLRDNLKNRKFLRLGTVIKSWNRGDGPRDGFYTNDEINGVPFLRVNNLKNNTITLKSVKYINRKIHNTKLRRTQVTEGNLVFAISGTKDNLGTVSIIPKGIIEANLNSALVRLDLDLTKITNEFFCVLFSLQFIRTQIIYTGQGAAQNNLNNEEISSLLVPNISLATQQKLVDQYQKAYNQKEQKEQEAKEILNSIDAYLLSELGITMPVIENSLESRVFKVNFSDISGERFDAFAVLNKDYKIEGGKYENFKLRQIAEIQKGQSITSAKIIDGDYPVIAGGQSSPYSHNVYNYKKNAITVSASGAYAGFVWYHNTPIFASDCSVIQSKDENNISTLFLAEVLKTKQKEIYNLQQGAGQPHVYSSDLVKLNIPVPPKEKQDEIIKHISEIRAKAKQLKKEAKDTLKIAKLEIEQLILGNK